MGINFRKRIKIAKGVYLNVGKNGVSTSFGVKGLTINSKGKVTASLPGTGLSYSSNLNSIKSNYAQKAIENGYSYIDVNNEVHGVDDIDDLKALVYPKHEFKMKPYKVFKPLTTIFVMLLFLISIPLSIGNEQEPNNIWKPILCLVLFYCYRIIRAKYQDKKIAQEKVEFAEKISSIDSIIDDMVENNGFRETVNIVSRNLWVGETKEQLISSIGEPIKISTKVSGGKTLENYYYNQINARSYGLIVDIENDIVKGWEIK